MTDAGEGAAIGDGRTRSACSFRGFTKSVNVCAPKSAIRPHPLTPRGGTYRPYVRLSGAPLAAPGIRTPRYRSDRGSATTGRAGENDPSRKATNSGRSDIRLILRAARKGHPKHYRPIPPAPNRHGAGRDGPCGIRPACRLRSRGRWAMGRRVHEPPPRPPGRTAGMAAEGGLMPRSERADRPRARPPHPGDPDAQLRGLVGAGHSRLPPAMAMRARDVDRPSEDDLVEAERAVVLRRGQRTAPAADPAVRTVEHGLAPEQGQPVEQGRGEGGRPRPARLPDGRVGRPRRPAPAPRPDPAPPRRPAGQDAGDAVPDAEGTSPVRS